MAVFFYAALVIAVGLFIAGVVTFFRLRKHPSETLVTVTGILLGGAITMLLFSLCLGFFMR